MTLRISRYVDNFLLWKHAGVPPFCLTTR